ncbi:hypothetical protein [Komagataeibacter swingsii]|uniref:hypothetical protein n=1 Tax=Komagataeibacter swingsii TaxID=215220 RepID=UPI0011B4636F|nr:hypothetical protein [Komagataeibacter swingsii]
MVNARNIDHEKMGGGQTFARSVNLFRSVRCIPQCPVWRVAGHKEIFGEAFFKTLQGNAAFWKKAADRNFYYPLSTDYLK